MLRLGNKVKIMEGLSSVRSHFLRRKGGLPAVLIATFLPGLCSGEIKITNPVRTCNADSAELRRQIAFSFPIESRGKLLNESLNKGVFDRAHCLLAATRFDQQLSQRKHDLKKAEVELEQFPFNFPACNALTEPGKTSVVLMSYPVGINGKLFGNIALINLFATADDSSEQFHRLIIHEWIHGFKTQRVDEPDDISNLLFFEGQATYGSIKISKEFSRVSIETSLGITENRIVKALHSLCRLQWTSQNLNSHLPELFSGNNEAFFQPRMGYFLGAKIIERLDRVKPWCEIDLAYFRKHYQAALADLQKEYCSTLGGKNDA
jgi:hypothetical protein